MQYLKRKHFSHRIQFHREKLWFIWKNFEKIKFFQFFFQNQCWPLVHFSNLCHEISKLFKSTGHLRLEISYYNFKKFSVKDNWSASILTKKIRKIIFFNFFCINSYFFCMKLNFMWKMSSFEVLHVENPQNLESSLSTLAIFW